MRHDRDHLYVAYLLRIWRAGGQTESSLRASLEDPRSGERRSFADLEALCRYLKEHVAGPVESSGAATEK